MSQNQNIITPHWSLPFQFTSDGSVLEVEQGSDPEIQNAIYAILSYEPGQLVCDPSFGMPEPTFRQFGVNIDALTKLIAAWEPRADEIIDRNPNWYMSLIDTITIRRSHA
jgi:hypothetical protein